MQRIVALGCLLSLASCLQLGNGSQASGGGNTGGAADSSPDASTSATGVNCGTDPSSGVTLCEGISSCPDEPIDQGQYPGCGYRIRGNTLDLECLCGDSLCPIGVALNCDQARSLLADQSALAVCAGVSEDRCTALAVVPTNSSNCDTACRDECAGDPGCAVLCGC
ncbi:MAG TPA: hypothetical protein VGI10_03185 [Polyangiaceae bacterium]